VEGNHWTTCVELMKAYHELLDSPLARDANDLAGNIEPAWPAAPARAFLLHAVRGEHGLALALRLVTGEIAPLDIARAEVDAGNVEGAFGAASFAAVRWSSDASGYFYAAEALFMAGNLDGGKELMTMSAERATGRQAAQGRKSLLELGRRHGVPREVIEDARAILGTALEAPDRDDDAQEDMGLEAAEDDLHDGDPPEDREPKDNEPPQ
jgi:hypothetical protein